MRVYCGIDYHKRTSTLCFINGDGQKEVKTVLSDNIFRELVNKKNLLVGVEASCGVNFLVDKIKSQGIEVKIINPNKFRAIGIGGKKTDKRDATALAECLKVNFIPEVFHKSLGARRLKSLLRIREQHVQGRVRLTNHTRGILREYGIKISLGTESFWEEIGEKLELLEFGPIQNALRDSIHDARKMIRREKAVEEEIKKFLEGDFRARRLMTTPGIGLLTTAAFLAVGDDLNRFKNSKSFASYLGLTPREYSSGDKRRMGSVSKAGQEILRRYLIHGARTVLRYSNDNSKEPIRVWANKLKKRVGMNKATVALAHKMSRIGFCLVKEDRDYRKVA